VVNKAQAIALLARPSQKKRRPLIAHKKKLRSSKEDGLPVSKEKLTSHDHRIARSPMADEK
jgi:hypothetical protein